MNLTLSTSKAKEIIDITEKIESALLDTKVKDGICNIYVAHTTCALTTMDLDPGTDEDMLTALEKMFPKGNYKHPHNPGHVGEHIWASLIGQFVTIPYANKKLVLGTWQRITLIELSGPRDRNLVISIFPSK